MQPNSEEMGGASCGCRMLRVSAGCRHSAGLTGQNVGQPEDKVKTQTLSRTFFNVTFVIGGDMSRKV